MSKRNTTFFSMCTYILYGLWFEQMIAVGCMRTGRRLILVKMKKIECFTWKKKMKLKSTTEKKTNNMMVMYAKMEELIRMFRFNCLWKAAFASSLGNHNRLYHSSKNTNKIFNVCFVNVHRLKFIERRKIVQYLVPKLRNY